MTAPRSLKAIRSEADGHLYPRHVLDGCETALVLFAAAFHGRQDAYWIADAGVTATCVDNDATKLRQMARVYPKGWEFVTADAFDYAAEADRQWDLVSVDCPTGAFATCAEKLSLWCSLARVAVVLGTDARYIAAPNGWKVTGKRYRSKFAGGVYWTVLEAV